MSLDPASLFLNIVISFVGLGLFTYGRKAERWPHLIAGVVLMSYPYLVGSVAALAGIGLLVVAALLATMWLGW